MDPNEADSKVEEQDRKIAVVVIHGMGEQKPMQTLRTFVVSTWQRNKNLFKGLDPTGTGRDHQPWDVWTKPDNISGSSELLRITTARARVRDGQEGRGQRADFFELHWADLTADNTWSDFFGWFLRLLWRKPWRGEVPRRVFMVWTGLWALTILLAGSAIATAWAAYLKGGGHNFLAGCPIEAWLAWCWWPTITAVSAIAGGLVKYFLTASFGDVARYVSAAPRNIKVRQEARQRGLRMLNQLTESGEYNRIIVVGHSLGSILAHDLVLLAWGESSQGIQALEGTALYKALRACEAAGDELLGAAGYTEQMVTLLSQDRAQWKSPDRSARNEDFKKKLTTYRQRQRELYRQLAATTIPGRDGKRRSAWLISDLITLGSPLTHAEFLLANNLDDLRTSTMMRETLRCPPVLETTTDAVHTDGRRLTFIHTYPRGSNTWRPHHGAAMAPVRWTNIHDASTEYLPLLGDLISGPLSRDFGPGTVDVKVKIARPRGFWKSIGLARVFTHTLYWTDFLKGFNMADEPPDHVLALQQALNFLDDAATETALLDRSLPTPNPSAPAP